MSAKTKSKIPLDVHTLARWLALDPKSNVKELEAAITKGGTDGFRKKGELYRVALKWAWDEQPDVFSPLTKSWLSSSNARLRKTAAGALPVSHPEHADKSIKTLKKLVTDKDRGVRLIAVDILAEDVARNLDLLKRWAKDPDPLVREIVARHLRHVKTESLTSVIPVLEPLALDPEPQVHWAAASTLLELYEREQRPILEIARQMASHDDPAIRSAAAGMFFEHVFADHFAQLQPTIRAWLRAGTPWLRWTLVRSLRFTLVNPRTLQLLRALYEDKDPDIRRRVIMLLLDQYEPHSDHRRPVTDLLRRAREDTSRKIRELVEGHKTHGEDYLNPYAAPIEDDTV